MDDFTKLEFLGAKNNQNKFNVNQRYQLLIH